MLDLVKVESGEKLPLSIQSFPVSQAIDEALIFMNDRAAQKKLLFKKRLIPDLGT